MFIYRVTGTVNNLPDSHVEKEIPLSYKFKFRVTELKVKETEKSYVGERKRINKENIGKISDYIDSLSEVGFQMYVFQEEIDKAKFDIKENILEELKRRESIILQMIKSMKEEPIEHYRKWREE